MDAPLRGNQKILMDYFFKRVKRFFLNVRRPSVFIRPSSEDTALINKALELGGYAEDRPMTGINGGKTVSTGFARDTVLGAADTITAAVKSGAIKHFFLAGGCDGAKSGRNYCTDFVKQTPKDTVILTLACGKYRFNDLDIRLVREPGWFYKSCKMRRLKSDAFCCCSPEVVAPRGLIPLRTP
jgi:hydroxylamine reductase (hybrid-cluster protein)